MKTIHKTLVVTATLILTGCGGGGSSSNSGGGSSDYSKIYKVEYTLNGSNLPTCSHANNITRSPAQNNDDIGYQNCTWYCGDYQGSVMMVTLSFRQNGKNGIWEFEDEILGTPPLECHH